MSFPKYPNPKDPNDELDYAIAWAPRLLDGETIESSLWEVVSGAIEVIRRELDNALFKAIIWVRGGAEGETAYLRNRIVTSGGRQYDQTVGIKIKTK